MAGFFIGIATDSLPLYQLQLCTFGAVALVFAVQGYVVVPLLPLLPFPWPFVRQSSFVFSLVLLLATNRANSVFGIIKAEQAAGAGWLILAIVDVRPSSYTSALFRAPTSPSPLQHVSKLTIFPLPPISPLRSSFAQNRSSGSSSSPPKNPLSSLTSSTPSPTPPSPTLQDPNPCLLPVEEGPSSTSRPIEEDERRA